MKTIALPEPLRSVVLATTLVASAGITTGCGVAAPCSVTSVASVDPATATADHMSVAPGDQQRFVASSHYVPSANSTGCAVPALAVLLTPIWTTSDPMNVKISSAKDSTNGLATCVGATKYRVTVTALGNLTADGATQTLSTATLTCK